MGSEDKEDKEDIVVASFKDESQMEEIMTMIGKDLSEPYSIFTYRYFIHGWPELCITAHVKEKMIGIIICKIDDRTKDKRAYKRGYIGMLAVDDAYRRRGIGTMLVERAILKMVTLDCEEAVLETEISNKGALNLYENLGFTRDKRLEKYYLNGGDAFRLKLRLDPPTDPEQKRGVEIGQLEDEAEAGEGDKAEAK